MQRKEANAARHSSPREKKKVRMSYMSTLTLRWGKETGELEMGIFDKTSSVSSKKRIGLLAKRGRS